MSKMLRLPAVSVIAKCLSQINKYRVEGDDEEGIDVRLQVYKDGQWAVRSGSSDYDQDHRGFWGASGVPGSRRSFNSQSVARDLIDQVENMAAQGGYEVKRKSPKANRSR